MPIQIFNSLNSNSYCPSCESDSVFSMQRLVFFEGAGKVLKSTLHCSQCYANSIEFLPLETTVPSTFKFLISDKKDLNAKVIKSQSCVFKIPELGVEINPGPESQAEILNVDGLLSNITLALSYEYGSNKLTTDIKKIKEGKLKATLVLEDPLGLSKVIRKK